MRRNRQVTLLEYDMCKAMSIFQFIYFASLLRLKAEHIPFGLNQASV